MKILALEFSAAVRSAAVLERTSPSPNLAALDPAVARAHAGQPAHPATLADQALTAAGCEREAVSRLAVGLGPGSYTGIRMALAFAQGWQLARPVEVIGISSALCLAHQMKDRGSRGLIHIAIDAQRREFYLGQYLISDQEVRESHPLTLVSEADLIATCQPGVVLAGPGLTGRFSEAIDLDPDALRLGELARESSAVLPAEDWVPIYLRPVQFVRAPAPRQFP